MNLSQVGQCGFCKKSTTYECTVCNRVYNFAVHTGCVIGGCQGPMRCTRCGAIVDSEDPTLIHLNGETTVIQRYKSS